MTQNVFEMNPVQAITAGAVGEPGQRTFYVQARTPRETLTLLAEKEQVQMLAHGIHQLLGEVDDKYPAKPPVQALDSVDLELMPPLEPRFRVGKLELGYDVDRDLVLLVVHELVTEEPDAEEDVGAAEAFSEIEASEEGAVARLWGTRAQMRAMADHALDVAARGRPVCVLCGLAYGPEGHVCPKKNGHPRAPAF